MPVSLTPLGAAAIVFTDASAGCLDVAGRYWERAPSPPAARSDWQDVQAAGVDWATMRLIGLRSRPIGPLLVVYVAADAASARGAWETDRAALEGKDLTVTFPNSAAYAGCRLLEGSGPLASPMLTEGAKYYMPVQLHLEQRGAAA